MNKFTMNVIWKNWIGCPYSGRGFVLDAFVSIVLAACQSLPNSAGKQDIWLSDSVLLGLNTYMRDPSSQAFAISVDGSRFSYITCPESGCRRSGRALKDQAIDACEIHGRRCALYAVGKAIIWTESTVHIGPRTKRSSDANLGFDRRVFQVSRKPENHLGNLAHSSSTIFAGTARIVTGNEKYAPLSIKFDGETCYGRAKLSEGRWRMTCDPSNKIYGGRSDPTRRILIPAKLMMVARAYRSSVFYIDVNIHG